jgi:hypothetical protein
VICLSFAELAAPERLVEATDAPASTSAFAIAAPMPREPPVTSATRPES